MTLQLLDYTMVEYKKHKDKVLSIAYNKGTIVLTFAEELRRLCKLHGLNFPLMFAQAWHETAGFTSDTWIRRKNPAGIKNRSATTYQSYPNGVDAARAFVVHMAAYVPVLKRDGLAVYRYLDSRFEVAVEANKGLQFRTINDLTSRWAEDPEYGEKIERVFNDLYRTGTT